MKIIILSPNYPTRSKPYCGIFVHQITQALVRLGVECHVLLPYNWYPPFGLHRFHPHWKTGFFDKNDYYTELNGVTIHKVPVFIKMPTRLFPESHHDRLVKAFLKYIEFHKELKDATLIFSHFLTDAGLWGAKIKLKTGKKLAAIALGDDVHAWPEENPELIHVIEFVAKHADVLLANSKNLANDVVKRCHKIGNMDVKYVYHGVDYHKFRPAASENEKITMRYKYNLPLHQKIILCVALPVALKGWLVLFDVLKDLLPLNKNCFFLAIGSERKNSDGLDLDLLAKQTGISEQFKWIRGVDHDTLAEIYRACDAFVLPSFNEGMANTVLESMASGLVTVATEVGGHNEIIENEKNGFLIPPGDKNSLLAVLTKVVNFTNNQFKQMGYAARDSMIKFGDYQQNAKKLLDIFKQL
jgi:glycosyltransferase involved in cell wall biosynthesis